MTRIQRGTKRHARRKMGKSTKQQKRWKSTAPTLKFPFLHQTVAVGRWGKRGISGWVVHQVVLFICISEDWPGTEEHSMNELGSSPVNVKQQWCWSIRECLLFVNQHLSTLNVISLSAAHQRALVWLHQWDEMRSALRCFYGSSFEGTGKTKEYR